MQYIDLSTLFGAIIAIVMIAFIFRIWPLIRPLIPAGALLIINWFASVVVNAVETEYKSGEGDLKREEAFRRITDALEPMISVMNKYGFTIEPKRIYEAIQAAWKQLDLKQIQAGEKAIHSDDVM